MSSVTGICSAGAFECLPAARTSEWTSHWKKDDGFRIVRGRLDTF